MPLALVLALGAAGCTSSAPPERSLLLTNVVLYDGTGQVPRRGALRMVGDTISAVGDLTPVPSDSVSDGGGLALAPGFVDTHSHHDYGLSESPAALAAVSQGITTIVVGQDGGQHLPLAAWFDSLARRPPAVNLASYAGHNTLRGAVLGRDFRRKAAPAEVDSMAAMLRRELGAGALGLSTGLEYDPGIYSDPSEVLALARVAADSGGRYISHIRSEDRWFWPAIDEILAIARVARLPVQISHTKLAMKGLWGRADSLLRLLDAARAAGLNLTADVYPYTYWQSTLTVLFPKRDFDNRVEAGRVLREIAPAEGLLLGRFRPDSTYVGKTVAEIARLRHTDAATTLMALIRESLDYARRTGEEDVESVIGTSMDEGDVARILVWPWANFCSDGELAGRHPRGFGTFPRILGRYVREQRVMPLEEAVRKASGLAAANVGLRRRGMLLPGYFADLVLFDPASVIDRATPAEPGALSAGIARVWVNGQAVFAGGKPTGAHPGRVLRR